MSPEGFTCVTVTEIPARSGSRISPLRRMSESAWRSISPTRIWRWVGPCWAEGVRLLCMLVIGEWRIARSKSNFAPPYSLSPIRFLKRPLDGLDLVALDDVGLLQVLVVRK